MDIEEEEREEMQDDVNHKEEKRGEIYDVDEF